MMRVGLTGGIGSGKSYVSRVFERLGVPVYYADPRARELMERSPVIREGLTALFGHGVYRHGRLNRSLLARAIFSDDRVREQVNRLVHPVVFDDFEAWARRQAEAPYVIQEAAILFESGADRLLDRVINISAPRKVRLQRVVGRDHLTENEVMARMRSQMSENERKKRAWRTIVNDGKRLVVPQVIRIHEELLQTNRTEKLEENGKMG